MPASETQEGRRGGRLLTVVFWIGVGLAPVAALLMLAGGASAVKVAAVLAILAVVLVGLSIMLKPDASGIRVELEETMLEEIDLLREDVRQDISTAARATHKSFSEKLQLLYENLEALRAQVDAPRGGEHERAEAKPSQAATRAAPPPAQSAPPVGATMVGGGVVRHTETVRETTRHTIVDQHADAERGGTVYGGTTYGARQADPATPPPANRRGAAEERPDREPERGRQDRDWGPGRDEREASWTEQRLRERLAEGRGATRAAGPPVEEFRGGYEGGGGHRGGYEGGGGHRGGHEGGGHRGVDEYPSGDVRGEDDWRPRRHDRDDVGDDPRWSDVRAGDRWAAVRTDDRGRELRMGERRAEMRSDESGTELRIEDRWASVRREEARREESRRDEGRRSEGRRAERGGEPGRAASREEAREPREEARGPRDEGRSGRGETRRERREREEHWSAEPSEENRVAGRRSYQDEEARSWEPPRQRRGSVPALPAGGGPPASSFTEGWREEPEREREPRRRREEDRDDRWERDDPPRGGGSRPRRIDFELSDDRWR